MRMTDRVAHIVEEPQACDAGNGLFDQLDALARKFSDKGAEPRDIPARVGKACTTPTLRGSPNRRHDDRNRRGGILGRQCGRSAPGDDQVDLETNQISRKRWKAFRAAVG